MTPGPGRPVVLVGSSDVLAGFARQLRRRGVSVVRAVSIERKDRPAEELSRAYVRAGHPKLIAITSRESIRAFVRPVLMRGTGWARNLTFYAAGPATARALRALGAQHVIEPSAPGVRGVAQLLSKQHGRVVFHPTSDRSRGKLVRQLRGMRIRVVESVAYTTEFRTRLSSAAMRGLRQPKFVVATSPSAIDGLLRLIARGDSNSLKSAPVRVLGPTTFKTAKRRGFRDVQLLPLSRGQGFSRA